MNVELGAAWTGRPMFSQKKVFVLVVVKFASYKEPETKVRLSL